ncbi:MFS transporter [Baekduia sp. Peel2402]|uniref:MFS transporter n=1 Tax=Baekduia sp. Peel2402 TaxID=3458296 RepID=UPI00403E527E
MTSSDQHHDRRWLILAILGIAQLMVVLDATIVNIALPSAQKDLGFGDGDRQWIVTAYALAFGSLLLLGGRIGDLFGRKWVFIAGLIGFAVASAIGGAAQSFGMLVTARAAQGVFGALLAPAALSLLATTFTDPSERNKAFGVFGAIAGSGAAVGMLLGGVLTETLDWRWCLYVNLVFAVVAAVGAFLYMVNQTHPDKAKLDIPGTLTASAGLFALVYGFSHAEQSSWGDATTLGFLIGGVVLLTGFIAIQQRVKHPLLPLRVVLDRDRGGAYLAMGLSAIAMFGVFLFLTFYLQQTLGFTPIQTGLAFLPMSFVIMVSATLAQTQLLPRFGARPLLGIGLTLGAVGMVFLTGIGVDSSYWTHVLPGLLIMGIGLGNVFAPAISSATLGVDANDAGVASATVNVMQQVGGSIGTALLSTLAASATTSAITDAGPRATAEVVAQAAVHGYTTAFYWSAAIFAVAAVICTALIRPGVHEPSTVGEPVLAH